MISKQKIYDYSPLFMQTLMTNIYGILRWRERYGKYYYEHLKYLQQFEKLPREDQLRIQNEELVKFVAYAVKNSDFYRKLYKDIDLSEIRGVNDLSKLPFVTKEMLRDNMEHVITIPKQGSYESHTGGTTGKSLVVHFTVEDAQKRMAHIDYFKLKHGFVNGKLRRATFSGKHLVPGNGSNKIFWRYNYVLKQMLYSTFHINETNIPYYIESLNKFKPVELDGFFSSIGEIAHYIVRHNVKLDFKPVAVFPTSETITPELKAIIEQAFNCPVRNQYASSEGAPYIIECPEGNLHYEVESGVFEIINEQNEVAVTSFYTHGTPLIRYRIGDTVAPNEDNFVCSCGMNTPCVSSVTGRLSDYLVAENGARINVANIGNAFKNIPNAVIKSQVIQEGPLDITVKIVVDPQRYKNHHKADIIDELKHKLGFGMQIIVQEVEDIPREASGKHRVIINRLGNQEKR